MRLDEERLVRLEVDRDSGGQLPVEVGVLGLRDHLPGIVVEGEGALVGGPVERARKRPGQDHVVAARPRHADLDAADIHPVGRGLLVVADELLLSR